MSTPIDSLRKHIKETGITIIDHAPIEDIKTAIAMNICIAMGLGLPVAAIFNNIGFIVDGDSDGQEILNQYAELAGNPNNKNALIVAVNDDTKKHYPGLMP